MAPCNLPTPTSTADTDQSSSRCQFWQTDVGDDRVVHDSTCAERDVEDASSLLQADLFSDDTAVATTTVDSSVPTTSAPSINTDVHSSSTSAESKVNFFTELYCVRDEKL